MMGPKQKAQPALFYEFSLEDHVPQDHLLRSIDCFVDLSGIRQYLAEFYSHTGRPSIDPELLIRMLLVGYCFGTENKIGLHFDRDVFEPDGRAYYSTWNEAGDFAKVNACPMGLNHAMVFMGGRQGVWLEKQGAAACTAFAVDRVADIIWQ